MARIKIYQSLSNAHDSPVADGASVHMRALGEGGIPSEIFVFQRHLPETFLEADLFVDIASPYDIERYPVSSAPALDPEGDETPFYRSDRIHLVFKNPSERDTTIKSILRDVNYLVDNWNKLSEAAYASTTVLDGTTQHTIAAEDQTRVLVSWKPAGTPALTGEADGDQTILNPDPDLIGWLPMSSYDSEALGTAPQDSKYFYNVAQDSAVAEFLDSSYEEPHMLVTYNGVILPPEAIALTNKTLFWKDFAPDTLPFQFDGNAPWPTQYDGVSDVFPQPEIYLINTED